MPNENLQTMLTLAKRLAREAAEMAMSRIAEITVSTKPDGSVVTEADREIEAYLLAEIAAVFPDHAVCAEESACQKDDSRSSARYCWVIDPIDGTRNYTARYPCHATSIAVLDHSRPVVGVILEHNLGAMHTATEGHGAFLNDKPMTVCDPAATDDMLLGVPSSKDSVTVALLTTWLATRGLVFRNMGSTAMHLAMVASGVMGAAYCKRCKIWDIAAGALMVTEAGGTLTDLQGQTRVPLDLSADPMDDLSFLAGAPNVHDRLLKTVRSHAKQG